MRLISKILLTAVFLSASVLFAEPEAVIPSGPQKGRKLDTSSVRTLLPATPEEVAQYTKEPGDIIVKDFRHEGSFWTARIPAGAAQEMIMQKVTFSKGPDVKWLKAIGIHLEKVPTSVHHQVRFKLKPGKEIELFAPPGETKTPVKPLVGDVTFSADALGPDMGKLFDPRESFVGEHVLARQVMSTQDSWAFFAGAMRFTVRQHKVDTDEGSIQRAFDTGIEKSRGINYTELFDIFCVNCAQSSKEMVDAAAGGRSHIPGSTLLHYLPIFTDLNLKVRGLGKGLLEIATLNDEMAYLNEDKDVKGLARSILREKIVARRRADMDAEAEKNGGAPSLGSFPKMACNFYWGKVTGKKEIYLPRAGP